MGSCHSPLFGRLRVGRARTPLGSRLALDQVWTFWISVSVIIFVILTLACFGEQGIIQILELRKETIRVRERTARLTLSNQELKSEILRMRQDPWAAERIAREQLGMVRANEKVYRFAP